MNVTYTHVEASFTMNIHQCWVFAYILWYRSWLLASLW